MIRIRLVIALLHILLLVSVAAAAEKLYFADNGNDEILRCDLDGTNLEQLVTTGIEVVGCIAIDRSGGKMYWTDWAAGTAHIRRADLDGGNVETLLTGLSGPWGIDLDVVGGKMYWTEFSTPRIRRANLDGSGVEDLVTSGLAHTAGIALDLAGGKMYWADGATQYSAKIQRGNLDGTSVETLVEDPLIAPQAVDLDLTAGKMYWSDLGTDSWFRANLDGTGLEEILLSAYGTPIGTALDTAATKLYVSEYGGANSEIKRCNPDGTGVEVLVSSGIGAVYGLTLGPAAAECSDAWLAGPWLVIVTGVEVYDYAVSMVFDGLGTITEMGAFNVPDPAGTYAVEPDCDLTGEIWTDGYTPFTGLVQSDSTAEMDIGSGPMQLLKVADVGALAECWAGWFEQDTTGVAWDVTLDIDDDGNIASSTGFPGPVTGTILTQDGYLAGHLILSGAESDELMFLDATAVGDTVLSGTYGLDCDGCPDGTFSLVPCSSVSATGETLPTPAVVLRSEPNPFNPRTTIRFWLDAPGPAQVRIYDLQGRLVCNLVDGWLTAGWQEIAWRGDDDEGRQRASGVYFCVLDRDGTTDSLKLTLVR